LTWPGLTSQLIRKNLPKTRATIQGHIKQDFKNLRLTVRIKEEDLLANVVPIPLTPEGRTNDCYFIICTKEEGTTYSDLCGSYPVKSARGNQYIVVCYDYNSNAILAEPIQTRAAANISNAVEKMLTKLTNAGAPPKLHILDNEASKHLKHKLLKQKIKY